MPAFLENDLKKEYGDNPRAIFGTMNKIGAMRGNKETAKGAAMQKLHDQKVGLQKVAAKPKKAAKPPMNDNDGDDY